MLGMDQVLFHLHLIHPYKVDVTAWKLIGFLGVALFTARWFVQAYATKKLKRVTVPMTFWYLSVAGSVLQLGYFIWGKNDSVGIMNTAFPMLVSIYNVVAHMRYHKPEVVAPNRPEES
jgi:lipid-A-disaccharide synthase-like uncharacterized protein